jgi:hypothetical protein
MTSGPAADDLAGLFTTFDANCVCSEGPVKPSAQHQYVSARSEAPRGVPRDFCGFRIGELPRIGAGANQLPAICTLSGC